LDAVMPTDEVSLRTLSACGRSRSFQVKPRLKVKYHSMAHRYVIVRNRRSW
jgi:hypothetical protein